MLPTRSDIVGVWSEDLGYLADLSGDTRIEFRADGSAEVVSSSERIQIRWEAPAPGQLILIVEGGRMGPFDVRTSKQRLPLGEYTVLESSGGLLPFDRRRFTRVE
ncbi:MAG TPA: hypothetical protein VKS79_03580 [Gemmataceae bacterium]|nr:hypothetical protein [Gemmataceae bacterium]